MRVYSSCMDNLKKEITALPVQPGVYIYKDSDNLPIYVGKAKNIQKRVKQYFDRTEKPIKTKELVSHIHHIETIQTVSEFDAILLEAKLIQEFQPKYNSIAKDDRSPIYIHIPTQNPLPIVELSRKPKGVISKKDLYIGPFQSVYFVKRLLRTIRSIIPFCMQNIQGGYPCFYTHLKLCHPCPSMIVSMDTNTKRQLTSEYRSHIFLLKDILEGKSNKVQKILTKKMNLHAKQGEFEEAGMIRDQLFALEQLGQTHFDPLIYTSYSTDVDVVIDEQLSDLFRILAPYYPSIQDLSRIECIDISHTSGNQSVGSLVTLDKGHINTSLYKRFKIKTIDHQNDVAMIKEVLQRRLKHTEWLYPQLLVIDGGKPQLHAAFDLLNEQEIDIPVIGIAKRYDIIVVRHMESYKELRIPLTNKGLQVIRRIRDESHRFAHAYHMHRRRRDFIPVN